MNAGMLAGGLKKNKTKTQQQAKIYSEAVRHKCLILLKRYHQCANDETTNHIDFHFTYK